MTTAEDIFWLYERNKLVYNNCILLGKECPQSWGNECLCYLKEDVLPVTIGDISLPCRMNTRQYIKIGEECPICIEPIIHKTNAYLTGCGHAFHKTCLLKTMEAKWEEKLYSVIHCPMCRRSIGLPEFHKRYNTDIKDDGTIHCLDELENFWITKDYVMCQPCKKDHYMGMRINCKKCMEYRKMDL